MAHGLETRERAVEDGNAGCGGPAGQVLRVGPDVIRQHHDRFAGAARYAATDTGERFVQIKTGRQVGDKDAHCGVRVIEQGLPAVLENCLIVAAGTPRIQRVHRFEPMIEIVLQNLDRLFADLCQWHTDVVCNIH